MNIVIIPGFSGYPEDVMFDNLQHLLETKGHSVIKVAWPNYPTNLEKYNFTETIKHCKTILNKLSMDETVIIGFSMGGTIACHLAKLYSPKKLALIVTPYQAGSEDDLENKYRKWKELGYRDITSSKFGDLRIPFSFLEDSMQYNALEIIDRLTCPVLYIVGELDEKVPTKVTKKLFESTNAPKIWHEIKGMKHVYKYQKGMIDKIDKLIVDFLDTENITFN